MSTTVVNVRVKHIRPQYQDLKSWMADPQNEYIGRGGVLIIDKARFPLRDSPLANPFKSGRDGTLEEVLTNYKIYIDYLIESGVISQEYLRSLKGKRLGCWCYPAPCHGNIVKDIVDRL